MDTRRVLPTWWCEELPKDEEGLHEDPSENPSTAGDKEGEEPEDPDGTDAGEHREDPKRAPIKAPAQEVAAIAKDVSKLEKHVPEVEKYVSEPAPKNPGNPALKDKSNKIGKQPMFSSRPTLPHHSRSAGQYRLGTETSVGERQSHPGGQAEELTGILQRP